MSSFLLTVIQVRIQDPSPQGNRLNQTALLHLNQLTVTLSLQKSAVFLVLKLRLNLVA